MSIINDSWLQDLRYGSRALWRAPGFTLVAALTLALGVGANTAVFSLVNAVLLQALPYPDPDRLVKIAFDNPGLGLHDVPFSTPELDDLQTRPGVFSDVCVVFPASVNVTGAQTPERLELLGVGPAYFSMLGVTPEIGRLFDSRDVGPGFAGVVVISDALWRRSYGADPAVLGRQLRLDNDLYTIVGVAPPGFRHPGRTVAQDVDVWATAGFHANPFPVARNARLLPGAIGRLMPGLTLAQAQARLDGMASDVRRDFPSDYPARARWSVTIQPLQDALTGSVQAMLLAVLGAAMAIILIAAVNVASLQLARASGRQREIGTRLALGASPARIVRQMLVEAALLAAMAGAAGVAGARVGLRALLAFLPAGMPRLAEVRLDGRVFVFALGVSVAAGLLFGLVPALQVVKPDLVQAIRDGASGSGQSARTSRLRQGLIAAEFALSVLLLVGAGLLLRTFWGLLRENPGFNPASVVAASVWLPVPNDPSADVYAAPAARAVFVRRTLDRVGALPGVSGVAVTSDLPASVPSINVSIRIESRSVDPNDAITANAFLVSPAYFQVLQVPLVRGRAFTDQDDARSGPVAIVDERTARQYWPDEDPIGRRIRRGSSPAAPFVTIVGVIRDMKQGSLDRDGQPHVFLPLAQVSGRALSVIVRTSVPLATIEPQIRREIQQVDPMLPVFAVRTMDDVIAGSLTPRRFSAELVGLFAALALLVASVGVYGLLAHLVSQRTLEIGLRVALGARPSQIVGYVVGSGLRVAGLGVAIGLAGAAASTPLLSSLLYGVRPLDPAVFVTVPLLLLAVTLVASYLPARRATRVNPALR